MHDLTLQMDDNPINLETVLQILRFRKFELQQLKVLRKSSGEVSVRLAVTCHGGTVDTQQGNTQQDSARQLVLQLAKRPGIYSVDLA